MSDQTGFSDVIELPDSFTDGTGNQFQSEAYKIFAIIDATSDIGLTISNVKEGDTITINSSSGIASFKESNMKPLKAFIGIANIIGEAAVMYATDGEAEPFLDPWNSAVKEATDTIGDTVKHARRDSYGKDPGTGDYGKDEGGLIVCMPNAKGAVYATSDYFLQDGAKEHGRQTKWYPKKVQQDQDVFYPCNVDGGLMSQVASEDGTVVILAFDSKFTDNAGYYLTEIFVTRGMANRPSGRSDVEMLAALASSPLSIGI